jgi:hypothetical protein
MNNPCEKIQDKIADYVLGVLRQEEIDALDKHISQCTRCREYTESLQSEKRSLLQFGKTLDSEMDARQTKVIEALNRVSIKKTKLLSIWRTIMRSPITKIAAVVVVISGVLITIHFAGLSTGTVTFADVIKPILNAQTAVLDIIIGEEEAGGPVIHDQIKGPLIRRTLSHMEDVVSIIDLETSRILSLTISKKEAAYVDLKGLPSMPNYLDTLRNIISDFQESPHFEVEELGKREVDGVEAVGFLARQPKVEITIWADPETALPVRIEQVSGQMKMICKNVKFDVPMDESLFSMDVPEGYKLQEVELDLMGSTEEDFVEGLRIRAEVFGGGQFPESVALEDFLKEAPLVEKKMDELGLSDEEETELGLKITRYLLFLRFFKGQGEWHYAGNGVKLGDAETAIFWYQPEGSETYRVIFGDLHVKTVTAKVLKELEK